MDQYITQAVKDESQLRQLEAEMDYESKLATKAESDLQLSKARTEHVQSQVNASNKRNMELSREIMTAQRDIEDIKARIKSRQDSFEGSEMLRTQASESKSHTEQSLSESTTNFEDAFISYQPGENAFTEEFGAKVAKFAATARNRKRHLTECLTRVQSTIEDATNQALVSPEGFEHQALIEQNSALEVGLLARRVLFRSDIEHFHDIFMLNDVSELVHDGV